MKITHQQFIDWIKQNKINHQNYIRVPAIQKLFVEDKLRAQHTKIMRVLLKHFLKEESIISYLTSKKIRKDSMIYNYDCIRTILDEILSKPKPK